MGARDSCRILLIEDDVEACNRFSSCIEDMEDVDLVGITNSVKKGLDYVQNYSIDAIILDIELHKGGSDGVKFVREFKKLQLKPEPMIVVTTNSLGIRLHRFLHKNEIEHIFHKKSEKKEDEYDEEYCDEYSEENVIDLILSLLPYSNNKNSTIVKIADEVINLEEQYKTEVSNKVNKILDGFGITHNLSGRKYIYDAISYIIVEEDKTDPNGRRAILPYLSRKAGKHEATAHKAIDSALKRAWGRIPPSELEKNYTARTNYNTGVPTPHEFIYHFAQQIKDELI